VIRRRGFGEHINKGMRSRFFIFASTLIAFLHLYIGVRLLPSLPIGTAGGSIGAILLVMSSVLLPLGMLARTLKDRIWADRLAWSGYMAMSVFSSLLLLTVLRDIALGVAALLAPAHLQAGMATDSAIAVLVLTAFATAIGLMNALRRARVVDVDVPIANLPAALQGFTIAQITDIHVGPTIKRNYLQAIVDAVNALQADMIAVTGDLVDGSVRELAAHTQPLAELTARHGVYFVTGNHEYYSGERAWTAELRRLGLKVLLNEHVVLHHDDARLVIAGVTDFSSQHFDPAHRSDPAAALAGAPADAQPRILLAHQPRSAPAAADAGYQLQISGHTHGGQFWPWNFFVRLQQPFTAGLDRLKGMWVYTSSGTGYWGPPNRFGIPSEITRLRLVRA
jgi:predicted MPP superfamily phosphohydrolase